MAVHPDQAGVERLRRELEVRIADADRAAAERRTATGSFPIVPGPSSPDAPVDLRGGGLPRFSR
jgi:hypothetical protein